MQLLFLDESGTTPEKGKNNEKYFVIGGVIISEHHWHDLDKDLTKIKKTYDVDLNTEFKWRFFSPHNKDKENGLKHLTLDKKNEIRDLIYKLIEKYKSIKIISVITNIEDAYKEKAINNANDIYWETYKQIVKQFQTYLQNLSQNSGTPSNGIVVIDNRLPCDDNRLRDLHSKHLKEFDSNKLIEGLFVAPSHLSTGIQFADMVTGAIFRKASKNDETYFLKIKNSIEERSQMNKEKAISFFPKKKTSS